MSVRQSVIMKLTLGLLLLRQDAVIPEGSRLRGTSWGYLGVVLKVSSRQTTQVMRSKSAVAEGVVEPYLAHVGMSSTRPILLDTSLTCSCAFLAALGVTESV